MAKKDKTVVSKKFYEWWKKSPKKRKQEVSGIFGHMVFIGATPKQAESHIKKLFKVKKK